MYAGSGGQFSNAALMEKIRVNQDRWKFEWNQHGLLTTYFYLSRDSKPWHQDVERKWSEGTWLFELDKPPYDKCLRIKAKYSKSDGPITYGFEVSLKFQHGDMTLYLEDHTVDDQDIKEQEIVKSYVTSMGEHGKMVAERNVHVQEKVYSFEWNIDRNIMETLISKEREPNPKNNQYTVFLFEITRFPLH